MHEPGPGLLCEQLGCQSRAFARIQWPGQPWRRACAFHCLLAVNIAAALRFPLCAAPLLEALDPPRPD